MRFFAHTRCLPVLPAVLLLVACGKPEAPPAPPPPAVEYADASPREVATVFEFVARTRAKEDAQLRARITGTIIERNFEEGQVVQEGDLLFRIDPRPYESAVNSAAARLSQAEAAVQVAERNYARGLELVDDGFISKAEMDKLLGERDGSRAALEDARAALEKARIDLAFTEIRAPFSGTAGRSQLSIGDLVDPGAGPLVSLVMLDPMLVDFDVNEQTLALRLRENQQRQAEGLPPVTFTPRLLLVTGDMYEHEGIIDYANNRINPTTGTVTVTARFPNPDSLLFPGQFARIQVQRGEPEMRLLIPQPAVLEDMQGKYVFIVDGNDTVQRRNVRLGQREGLMWVVESGLEEGDRVIVNGVQKVRQGAQVSATAIEQAD
jgi:RND family efflux transporter MFP subunit